MENQQPQHAPGTTDSAALPYGPRPQLDVIREPYMDPFQLEGTDPERHYVFGKKDDEVALYQAKLRGYQVCRDPNIDTTFDHTHSTDPKVYGDLVLMETTRRNADDLAKEQERKNKAWLTDVPRQYEQDVKATQKRAHQDAWQTTGSITQEAVEEPRPRSTSSGSSFSFPNNPLGK